MNPRPNVDLVHPRGMRYRLAALLLVAACGAETRQRPTQATEPQVSEESMVQVHVFDDTGRLVGPVSSAKVEKTDEEWRAQLSDEEFRITRGAGTERPFCGTLLDNKKEGVYSCVGCGLPLFSSDSKFKSGTGWPSFFQPVAKPNVAERVDNSLGAVRTEINCARCDAHLGHVFPDGPKPTGLRFCLNSESMRFTDSDKLKELADPAAKAPAEMRASVVFAGGCFWCVEAVFEELDGVYGAESGYAGGTAGTANYEAVCSGNTGHAEVVRIEYDPAKLTYEELLAVHFATHDPTTLNRQGNDTGPQYRSSIFYADEREKETAEAYLEALKEAGIAAVTTLEKLETFYPAEKYHQNFVCNNPNQGYVRGIALPKVEKVRAKFKDKLKPKSPLDAR